MSIIPPITAETASPEQARVAAVIAGARGNVPYSGPYAVLLHDPALAERANALGDYLRLGGTLPRRLAGLAILLTVRHWRARYAWTVHARNAVGFGLGEAFVTAVRTGTRPDFAEPDDETVYDYVTGLLAGRGVPDALEQRAVAALGAAGVADLVGIVGLYTMIGLACVAFDPPLPGPAPDFPD